MKGHGDSLLDFMGAWAECKYLSDLHHMTAIQRTLVLRRLEQVKPQDAALAEWIDALTYLTDRVPALTAEDVRQQIITALLNRDDLQVSRRGKEKICNLGRK